MSVDISDIVNNFQTAANDEITCKGIEDEGRAIEGVEITNDKKPKIKSAKCAQMKVIKDIYNVKKDTKFSKSCDCELVSAVNGKIVCPANKFLMTVHPGLDKGVCCKPCTTDNSLKLSASNVCEERVINRLGQKLETQCPKGGLVKEAQIMPNGIKVECCNPATEGEAHDKDNAMQEECTALNVQAECNQKSIDEIKNKCVKYQVDNCKFDTVHELEAKCLMMGLDTMDMINANPTNMCSSTNVSKLEQNCINLKVGTCTISNLAAKKEQLKTEMRNQLIMRIVLVGSSISLVLIVAIVIIMLLYRNFFRRV